MKLGFLSLLLSTASGAVVEATDADLENYLSNGVPTILDFYATWCTHCKSFSPVFDELSELYEHLPDKVQFIKVDGDTNRQASKRFGLEYFPTIKFVVNGEALEEIEDRKLQSMKKFIEENLGVTPEDPPSVAAQGTGAEADADEKSTKDVSESASAARVPKEQAQSFVLKLDDNTFEDAIDGKHALVAFTTTWCHYCKALSPEWEAAARLYANDDDIVFVNVDSTDTEPVVNLMETFHVNGFPTIIYFPADGSVPKPYSGPRIVDGFVDHFKRKGISHREADGKLGPQAGLIPDLDLSVLPNFSALEKAVKKSGSEFASKWEKIIIKAREDASYLVREGERLGKLLTQPLKPVDHDNFQIRLNIINAVQNALNADDKKEL